MAMDREKLRKIMDQCEKFLPGRGPRYSAPAAVLERMAEAVPSDARPDVYGSGELIESFEKEIASLLGKQAAVFMPSGTMAQQIALRIWSEKTTFKNVAFHPTCHLELHEQMGYRTLHHLQGVLVGSPYELLTLDDLKGVRLPLSSLLLELPQREIGGVLPGWESLVEITSWAREKGIRLHMDGARLWECKPFYQREYAEIAALFDSVYVSLYKGLGAIAGSVLCGPEDFIAEARVWLRRHGGNLISMYPFVLSARYGLKTYLPRMEQYLQKAIAIANTLSQFPQVRVKPNPPHTNMMHVFIEGDKEKMEDALAVVAQEQKIMLFRGFSTSQVPGVFATEITIQDGALEISQHELQAALTLFIQKLSK